MLSEKNITPYFEPVGDIVEAKECAHSFLLAGFFGNSRPSHTGLIDRMLDEADADVLMNADVVTSTWTVLLYGQQCTRVRGQPARRVQTQAEAPDSDGEARS